SLVQLREKRREECVFQFQSGLPGRLNHYALKTGIAVPFGVRRPVAALGRTWVSKAATGRRTPKRTMPTITSGIVFPPSSQNADRHAHCSISLPPHEIPPSPAPHRRPHSLFVCAPRRRRSRHRVARGG